ncbi:MAG: glycosyltransferase family 4 protein [Chloroflexota bacterium]|nr:glycosyltransferase family 4 protein [Chloroflexota bacterium]
MGIDRNEIAVTYNGLDFSLLDPTRPALEVRAELGLAADDFVLGTAAHLRRWKRIDRLLELLRAIQDPRLRLLVVGDGEDRARLEGVAGDLRLSDRAIFAGEQVQIGDYLQTMDAFCLPSMGLESFGNAAVEAAAVGVPTIVFADGGGTTEHIEPGETGFIVGDAQELAATMRRLLTDQGLRRRVGGQGRTAIRAKYSLEQAASRYEALYETALRENRA